MRNLVLIVVAVIAVASCKKKTVSAGNCFPNAKTTGTLSNKTVTVKLTSTGYILTPENTIDTWYIPCNLPKANEVNNQQLVIDADIKENTSEGRPCCVEDIVITKLAVK